MDDFTPGCPHTCYDWPCRACDDTPDDPKLHSIGFTFGVGLCEELCKSLPLLWHFKRTATLDVRGAVVWTWALNSTF